MPEKRNNYTLIGMPGAGKSTIGVLLAKALGYEFIDTDLVIQQREGKLLKEIIAESGNEGFKLIEEDVNASIEADHAVIAPGGSAIYSDKAMAHFCEIGTVIYLKLSYKSVKRRLGDLRARGVVLKEGQTLHDLYCERVPLYEKYADVTVELDKLSIGSSLEKVLENL
jgi:shikimate kinase